MTSEASGDQTGTPAPVSGCPFGSPQPCRKTGRHHHEYQLGTYGARRCSCGSRSWQIAVGGPLPPKVSCPRCSRDNYSATCYEIGRTHGPRPIDRGDNEPPF